MPPAKKRKTRATAEENVDDESSRTARTDESIPTAASQDASVAPKTISRAPAGETKASAADTAAIAAKAKERLDRFKALQARAKTATETNLKEASLESQRLATDPNLLSSLNRKSAVASHNLMRADTEAAGEDFERKRAWDWTIEESEKWDKRIKKKGAHREDASFQDYRQDARKIYKRQMRNLNPDTDHYEKEKMAAVEKAAASGGLEIVETEDGELVAVDKEGTFYSTADSTGFVEHKPPKEAVDKLVKDLSQAEDVRIKKTKERLARNGAGGDVTYVNEANKQFNAKLSRFYNKVSCCLLLLS